MAELLLAKLQEKPTPKEHKPQLIAFNKEKIAPKVKQDVTLNVPILDKRPTATIDRKSILKKLQPKINVESKIPEISETTKQAKVTATERLSKVTDTTKQTKLSKVSERPPKVKATENLAKVSEVFEISESERQQIPQKNIKKITVIDVKEQTVKSRITKKHDKKTIAEHSALLNAQELIPRLPPPAEKIILKAPSYYLNNRKLFVNKINALLIDYKEIIDKHAKTYNCNNTGSNEFTALPHQNLVRDYINLVTPYRGLLLYHGLGSGKTCSSIGIAEGLKSDKQIVIMTPASLRTNYIEELKKCGDILYKKHQYWEFINIKTNPELLEGLSYALSLSTQYITEQGGAWFVNINEASNHDQLTSSQHKSLDEQLNEMIKHKYHFINYNGLRQSHLDILTEQNTVNPFSNKVIIIDEAHNFISRIVNKLKRKSALSLTLYHLLMSAENTKIILLTGTPIINYPNEIAIMMNILRGYIETYTFKLDVSEKLKKNTHLKITEDYLTKLFRSKLKSNSVFDYLEYNVNNFLLTLTRNPYGYIAFGKPDNNYDGVTYNEAGNINNSTFIDIIVEILGKDKITVIDPENIESKIIKHKCLPDSLDDFSSYFIKTDDEKNDKKKAIVSNVKNMNQFKRRILGLISYFPDIDALLPKYEKMKDFHVIIIPMSDFQFGVYEEARVQERKIELNNAKKRKKTAAGNIYEESTSTYRIFSRAFCNFVFPRPDIKRPMPREDAEISELMESADEDLLDAISIEEKLKDTEGKYDAEELKAANDKNDNSEIIVNENYEQRIISAVKQLEANSETYFSPTSPEGLQKLSPKFLHILENITDEDHIGLHLIYSQFRTLEGIGILALILKANGYSQFKIKKNGANWSIDIPLEERGNKTFVLYTGTETAEEKEIMRNIFNSNWDAIKDQNLKTELQAIHENNFYGEIIKVIMITASGAEGISLSNVRYVHITEPYWHPVRIEQVIGRARRICSHTRLEPELQTVEVFLYLMKLSDEQKTSDLSIELRLKDKSKLDKTTPYTSDEALFEISNIKENINREIIHNIKEASIDCNIHTRFDGKEKLKCFTFGTANPNTFSYLPSLSAEEDDTMAEKNIVAKNIEAVELIIPKIGKCVLNTETDEVYDYDSYMKKKPIPIGRLITVNGKKKFQKL